jgi:hypothetical protein
MTLFKGIMKNLFLLILLSCLVSCVKKKDWNCTCDVTGNNFGRFTKTIPHETQNKANTQCGDWGKELMGSGGSYNCKLTGA